RHVYASRRRQLLLAGSLVAIFVVSLSVILEPDPDTGLTPVPGDYLWVVIPGAILIAVLAWRSLKASVVTDEGGVDIVRVVGHERIPWRTVRRFEVHPTPGKQGYAVLARLDNEVLVKVWTEIMIRPVRDRAAAKQIARARADALATALEADRRSRQVARVASGG
ncbi:MAG TPA: hypothetical protein VLL25_02830, partial [Acidimicrobiales bacterium]|nr:hypothetical protein [Acidimicrobiales bacterium]